jgi:hypothetical protein
MSFIQLSQVAVVVARTTGKKALYLAAPLYMVVGITVFVLFAGNGMDASYVTALAFASPPLRLVLLVGWAMLTLPVARLLLTDPQTFFLRTLPVPRWWLLGIVAMASACVQLAWLVLWVRGAGALSGGIALLAVLGAQSYAIAGLRDVREWVGLGCVLLGWQLAPSPAALALLVPTVVLGLRLAWIRAPEPRASGRHHVLASSATLAAATAFGISAYRSNGSAVARAATLTLLAFAAITLGSSNNPQWTQEQVLKLALAIWGSACVLGSVTLARPILIAESELTWLLDVCGMSLTFRALTGIGLLACIGAVGGSSLGLALWATRASGAVSVGLVPHLALTGAALGAYALALIRITARGTGRDSGRQLLGVLGLCIAAGLALVAGSLYMIAFSTAAAIVAARTATQLGVVGAALVQRGS